MSIVKHAPAAIADPIAVPPPRSAIAAVEVRKGPLPPSFWTGGLRHTSGQGGSNPWIMIVNHAAGGIVEFSSAHHLAPPPASEIAAAATTSSLAHRCHHPARMPPPLPFAAARMWRSCAVAAVASMADMRGPSASVVPPTRDMGKTMAGGAAIGGMRSAKVDNTYAPDYHRNLLKIYNIEVQKLMQMYGAWSPLSHLVSD